MFLQARLRFKSADNLCIDSRPAKAVREVRPEEETLGNVCYLSYVGGERMLGAPGPIFDVVFDPRNHESANVEGERSQASMSS